MNSQRTKRWGGMLVACVALALAGCGSDSTGDSTTAQPAPKGPFGVLGTSSIGPVKVGASEDQVRAAFGEPNGVKDNTLVNGIKVHDLIWTTPNVRLQFDPASGKFLSYTVTSSDLQTADGIHVGTPIAEIKKKYGNRLGDALGVLLLSEGKKGTFPGILFAEKNGTVFRIDGGNVVLND